MGYKDYIRLDRLSSIPMINHIKFTIYAYIIKFFIFIGWYKFAVMFGNWVIKHYFYWENIVEYKSWAAKNQTSKK